MSTHEVTVPVSIGELIDKMTILEIKSERIADAVKVANVKKELDALRHVCRHHRLEVPQELTKLLKEVNEKLWVIEDEIRDKERNKEFDSRFIELARAVYITNDRRFEIKNQINRTLKSSYTEEKSYQKYQ